VTLRESADESPQRATTGPLRLSGAHRPFFGGRYLPDGLLFRLRNVPGMVKDVLAGGLNDGFLSYSVVA
jgi:hypothetical protein